MSKGFSLVEILVSLAIFGIFVVMFVQFFEINRNSYENVLANNQALLIAQEGIEVSKFLGENNYASLSNGDYGLEISGGTWSFNGNSDIIDEFERTITISEPFADTKKIESRVTYDIFGNEKEFSLSTYLTDWSRSIASAVCQSSKDFVDLDFSAANLNDGNTLLTDMFLINTGVDCEIIIDKIRVRWDPRKPNRRINEVIIDGNSVWAGNKKRNRWVDISDVIIATEDEFLLEFRFDGDMGGRTFDVRLGMSGGGNANFNVILP